MTLNLCDTASYFITVNPVNDAPVAVDDADTTPEDTPITIDVQANDSDLDGDALTTIILLTGKWYWFISKWRFHYLYTKCQLQRYRYPYLYNK